MNQFIIQKYINKITKKDIITYAQNNNIYLTDEEINTIYFFIKQKTNDFLKGNREKILKELKQKVSPTTYQTIETLYNTYKNKLP